MSQLFPSSLSPGNIAARRDAHARRVAIKVVAETGSTNADLLAAAAQLREPTLLIAENQTAGRGRAGRSWQSEPGATLTFSLAWKFDLPPQALVGLPLAVGTVIAETLARFDVDARLKWPNDVLLGRDKMAGVLIETAPLAQGEAIWAVIGIGINVAMPQTLAARIDRPVAAASNLRLRREEVLAVLLDNLCTALESFAQHGFAVFAERWNQLHAWRGLPVVVVDHGEVLQRGSAWGVDEQGQLLLDTARGRIAIVAGDVSLRGAEG
ncbi:MAG TPA: biotin--[acetyl-CoA-carboxylase] ligase [Burkholderiaceae bacterium]